MMYLKRATVEPALRSPPRLKSPKAANRGEVESQFSSPRATTGLHFSRRTAHKPSPVASPLLAVLGDSAEGTALLPPPTPPVLAVRDENALQLDENAEGATKDLLSPRHRSLTHLCAKVQAHNLHLEGRIRELERVGEATSRGAVASMAELVANFKAREEQVRPVHIQA